MSEGRGSAARVTELEEALARHHGELEAFAVRAAHDLKSPLAVIRGMADTLDAAWDRLDEVRRSELLRAISANAERAAQMVTDLFALAGGAGDAGAGPAELTAVVPAALAAVERREGDRVEVEGEWRAVAAPASEVAAVLDNLLANAAFYGRSGDGVLRVVVRGWVEGDEQVLAVDDAGPGIPEEARPTVFDAFVRGDASRTLNPASTGIGLAIVRRAVERAGGSVGVGSSPEGGARLWCRLPLAPGARGGPRGAPAA